MKSKFTKPGMLSMYGIRAGSSYFLLFVISCLFVIADAKSQIPVRISNQQLLVKKIYTSQIGIREKPSNSGPHVENYLRYVGLSKGNPWCAAFVCWVFGEAGISNPRTGWSPGLFGERYVIWGKGAESGKLKACRAVGRVQKLSPGVSTCGLFPDLFGDLVTAPGQEPQVSGASLAGQNRANLGLQLRWRLLNPGNLKCAVDAGFAASAGDPRPSRGRAPGAPAPLTGDIFGLFFPEKGRIAHVGFIDQWDGTWMISVEGNTNVAGSREGDGVYRKRRLVRSVYKVARYINH